MDAREREIRARLAAVPSGYVWLREDVAWLLTALDSARADLSECVRAVGHDPATVPVREAVACVQGAARDLFAAVAMLGRERDAAVTAQRAMASKLAAALDEVAKLVPVADAEAVAAERERCALVCEKLAEGWRKLAAETQPGTARRCRAHAAEACVGCAAAIRRGGE